MEKQFLFVDAANPTWLVYVSVLVLAVFFRFSRIFTVRNLDVLLILLLSTSLVVTGEWRGLVPDSESTGETLSTEPVESSLTDSDVANPSASELKTADRANNASDSQSNSASQINNDSQASPDALQNPGAPRLTNTARSGTDVDDLTSDAGRSNVATDLISEVATAAETSQGGAGSPSATDANAEPVSEPPISTDAAPLFHPAYQWSSVVLLVFSFLLMLRLVFDETLTRRPRLEQNLNQAGLAFLCIPAFGLLMCSVFFTQPPSSTVMAVEHGRALLHRREAQSPAEQIVEGTPAPTETLLAAGAASVAQLSGTLPEVANQQVHGEIGRGELQLALTLVVIAHTIVVLGLLYIGKQHFGSMQLGLSMSLLYLLLPSTGYHVHQLSHVLPGACLTWAIASYRKPGVAGVLLGLACGTLFFAIFLVPLWAVFYGRRGAIRFGLSLLFVAAVLVGCLMLTSSDTDSFMRKIVTTTNWTVYRLLDETGSAPVTPIGELFVRIPLAAVFFVMLTAMTVLPRPRNLENLLANSAALVVAAQLWYPDDIGTYVLWYLPLFLLVIFRPRLDRFTPPEVLGQQAASVSQPVTTAATASVAMSRMTLYQ